MNKKRIYFTEHYGEAVEGMDDKHAGQFIKILWAYQKDGKEYKGNDAVLKTAFALAKGEIDRSNLNSRNGRVGGLKTAENRRTVVAVQVKSPTRCRTGTEFFNKALGGK